MTKESRWAAARRRAEEKQRTRRPEVPLPPVAAAARRVDLGRVQRLGLLLGGLLTLALGLAAEIAAVADLTVPAHSTPVRVVLGVLGVPFLAAGAGLLGWRFHAPPQAYLDVDADGLTHLGRTGVDWRLGWADLAALTLIRTRARVRSRNRGASVYLAVSLPRHYLRLRITGPAARRPDIAGWLSGSPTLYLDLGVSPRLARELAGLLGPHLTAPGVERVGSAAPGPGDAY